MPKNIVPTFYDIQLKPYIGRNESWPEDRDFTFDGSIKITFKCTEPTDKIIMHAVDLNIDKSSISLDSLENTQSIQVEKNYQLEAKRQFVIFNMGKQCAKDKIYILSMNYTGLISQNLYGFYRASYKTSSGQTV